MQDRLAVLYTTVDTLEAAKDLAHNALEAQLAACVNIIPQVTSIYIWENEVQESQEFSLIFKTIPEKLEALKRWLPEEHPYEVPAVLTATLGSSDDFWEYVCETLGA